MLTTTGRTSICRPASK